jgi:RHS repeat-associated protein
MSDPVPPPAGGGGTSYLTTDHLGSTRVVTKSDGTVKARYDYLPFGEELGSGIGGRSVGMGYSAADATRQKFTQKERDSESGLDYFGARYYSSAQGRFSSVDQLDPVMGKQGAEAKGEENAKRAFLDYLSKPQHWNRYLYVLNNPLRYIDPDGFQETITVGVQIVWDKNTQYSDKEKEEIKRRYLKEANKGLNRLGITLVVVAERTGTATNLANENRSIEGYTENNVNIFFTKNNSLPSTEVTRYDEGSIFIQTHTPNFFFPGESSTDSDLALHGSLHAFGLSVAKTGSYRAAERMVLITMEYLDKGDRAFVDIGDDRAAYEAMTPSLTKILRDGAQKYAIGRKVP